MPEPEAKNGSESIVSVDELPFPLYRRGKVRDVFDLGDRLLIVATDRLSAFDVVLPTPIPGKGRLLTAISDFWFDRTAGIVPNHRTGDDITSLGIDAAMATRLDGRASIVRRAERIDIECVVRRYLAGTGWKEYSAQGTLAGERLPSSLRLGDPLPEPRFTPAAKNDAGHDENISRDRLAGLVGGELAGQLEALSLRLYDHARRLTERAGFILADTKFEFGHIDGTLTLIDEALTPDSSRYWDIASWQPGQEPPSFDKQVVRDWLESIEWNKEPPGPKLPEEIVATARSRYAEVMRRLESIENEGK